MCLYVCVRLGTLNKIENEAKILFRTLLTIQVHRDGYDYLENSQCAAGTGQNIFTIQLVSH